ncbi:phosphoglucosamine mutase [Trichlorobacter sp.]|uniref:phosphoglucosamine mutase n=1 Tax=Trichlorobacter sp. TaxID=2911007 RepID=UPI00243A35F5|nr:phosphoglucosamine mutase [Trichlorobacter sp.]MCB5248025.1 phosphoglucosamine mutase [Candidatus Cloacimonadota bacterium]MDY0383540.1 phosphoglucosamine mutase [Trichlorobacter sp.]
MKKLFGTDGVRGVANVHPMTTEMAMQLGRAAAYIFKSSGPRRHRIVIGKDTRLSGYMLESALLAGICSMGVDVLLVGPLPTPGIANITKSMRADAGVVISASHNAFQDNGIKFFSADGFKLPDEIELKIEKLIDSKKIDSLRPTATEVGKAFRIDDAAGRYIVFLKNSFPADLDLSGLKIVLDCANGAAYKVAPAVFEELGAEVIPLGVRPNGSNINAGCGSLHPEVISEAVKQHQAHIGIALDGDADRVIVCDEFGNEVNGDQIMAICATDMLARKTLKKKTLVATVMSNMGLDIALRKAGGKIIKTAVGDRYVVEEMRKGGYNLGGEQSGHLIFLDNNTTGDGVLAALQLLAVMRRREKPLSELAEVMIPLPQVLVNVRVRERKDIMTLPSVAKTIRDVEQKLGDEGRVLIRYSGTEPLLRIMLEGQDKYEITTWANEIGDLVKQQIGAH